MDDQPDRPAKRAKTSFNPDQRLSQDPPQPTLVSLHRSITPPPARPGRTSTNASARASPHDSEKKKSDSPIPFNNPPPSSEETHIVPSPIRLTRIRDFSDALRNNEDTVRLKDLLGDPLIRECWQFNFLFDVDFLMQQFDEDIRGLVSVKVVHGSWKRESDNRVRIDEACQKYSNVETIVAYMPEPFGTHHTKMMILLRHDDLAQVIIHTANMIPGDWANMCQAVWRSPLLPLKPNDKEESRSTAWGSGSRFKRDILAYLKAYGVKKTGPLVEQLVKYDFGAVRAAFIASVPSKQRVSDGDADGRTLWGWPAMKDALRNVPLHGDDSKTPHMITQMSSIATLGQTDKWLREVFFSSLAPSQTSNPGSSPSKPKYSIIFPTAEEIRRSLNGYNSGGSIHMKLQSAAQQKQLQYLRPYLCHWAGDVSDNFPPDIRDAGRRRAAPHIKTYIRFTDEKKESIDWALVTSANLSTQAWGAAVNSGGEVRICSWEVGVLVWPGLYTEPRTLSQDQNHAGQSVMVPCFRKDNPDLSGIPTDAKPAALVGFRMPYDLPLTSYSAQDVPWCATMPHAEPDWMGQIWTG